MALQGDSMKKVLFLFAELNDDDLDWMITYGNLERVPRGVVLIEENQEIDHLYILLEGAVSVSIGLVDRHQQPIPDRYNEIAVLGDGEIFGEMSFVDQCPASASVETIRDSLVLSIPRGLLAEHLNYDVGFASRFYQAIALFLSTRLRSAVKTLGYQDSLKPEVEHINKQTFQDPQLKNILENLPMVEARFDWLLRRLKNKIAAENRKVSHESFH